MASHYQIEAYRAPWGDYGDISWNGSATEDAHGLPTIRVSRTGPSAPERA
jgi:hypothetical protein